MIDVFNLQFLLLFFIGFILLAVISWYLELSLKVFYLVSILLVLVLMVVKTVIFILY
ncbi:MAG: hypothetical protein FWE45_04435 [Firmicutes bacterium]|nr:hypothetical protein [Bacillota bacterium]